MSNKERQKRYREKHKDKIKQYDIANKEKIKERRKIYYENNKEIIKEKVKKRAKINKDKILEYQKKYYEANKDKARAYEKENKNKIKARHTIWKQNNKEHIKQYQKEYDKEYRKTHKDKQAIRNAFRRIIDNWQGGRADAENLLGYTFKDLQIHLSRFGDIKDKNMEIDHIVPISYLRKYIKDEHLLLKAAHDLRNLMLLSKKDNADKKTKLTIEYIPYFHMYSFFEYVCELIEYKESLSKENESSLVI